MTAETTTVHPMVMKADAVINAAIAKHSGESPELVASLLGAFHEALSFEILTDCGALECLEAFEGLYDMALSDSIKASDLAKSAEALGKVYGSANHE
jgi:hypothetical protein